MRIGLVVNPTAGKRTGALIGAQAVDLLRSRGHDLVDLSGADAVSARDQARAAVEAGRLDALVVSGGDGMVNLGLGLVAGTDLPLGIVAAGTGNDIARELGLPVRDAVAAVDRIELAQGRRIDLARCAPDSGGSQAHPRWFGGVLAAGFDAVVNERANGWRWPKGQMRYNLAILRELPVFRPIPYAVEIDGTRHETRAMLVAVGNGPAYGGGMRVTPDASFDDGLLDVLILREIGLVEFLRVLPTVYTGAHVAHPAVEVIRGRSVRLEAEGIVAYADGERLAPLPLTCEVVPGAATVLT